MRGCLVLDVRMEGMSGVELFERLLARGSRLPVIFLTGHGDVPLAVAALKKGAFDFVEKPFNDNDLVDRIVAAVRHDEAQRRQLESEAGVAARLAELTARERQVMERVARRRLQQEHRRRARDRGADGRGPPRADLREDGGPLGGRARAAARAEALTARRPPPSREGRSRRARARPARGSPSIPCRVRSRVAASSAFRAVTRRPETPGGNPSCALASPSPASPPASSLAPAVAQEGGTLKKIKDSGTISLGHRESSIPFSYYDDKQQVVGYSHDLMLKAVDAVKAKLNAPEPPGQAHPGHLAEPDPARPERHDRHRVRLDDEQPRAAEAGRLLEHDLRRRHAPAHEEGLRASRTSRTSRGRTSSPPRAPPRSGSSAR